MKMAFKDSNPSINEGYKVFFSTALTQLLFLNFKSYFCGYQ